MKFLQPFCVPFMRTGVFTLGAIHKPITFPYFPTMNGPSLIDCLYECCHGFKIDNADKSFRKLNNWWTNYSYSVYDAKFHWWRMPTPNGDGVPGGVPHSQETRHQLLI